MAEMLQSVLELRDISHEFSVHRGILRRSASLRAVDSVDLSIRKGEILGLVGESGCGKSTLSKIVLGLLKPSRGTVLFKGKQLHQLSRRKIARFIQPIFQDPYSSLNPRRSIASIMAQPLLVQGVNDREVIRRRVTHIMDMVRLPSRFLRAYPGQLSGGQRQRVAIARALILQPEVVICDEPTSALDVSVQSQILNLLLELRQELELTYLFISHNLAVVEHLATRVAVMYLGRIVELQETGALFSNPRHPYSEVLLRSVIHPDPHLEIPDLRLKGSFPNPIDPPSGCSFHPRCPKAMDVCQAIRPPGLRTGSALVECHLHREESAMTVSPKT